MVQKIRAQAVKVIKASLVATRDLLGKSRHLRRVGRSVLKTLVPPPPQVNDQYDHEKYYPAVPEYHRQCAVQRSFKYRPLISVLMPTYNTNHQFLRECVESILMQSYDKWELCIADDASPDQQVVDIIREYAERDARIKFTRRSSNGHISMASNTAMEMASGEFMALMDHDDLLWPNALFEVVHALNVNPQLDLIHSDEDKVDEKSAIHTYPFFKPEWSPEFLESCNYITHFSCIRSSLMRELAGFRAGCEGAQDWDLFLRISEKTKSIHHIPKILYSWRKHGGSTSHHYEAKPYVFEAQEKSLGDRLGRTGEAGKVRKGIFEGLRALEYAVDGSPTISILLAVTHPGRAERCARHLSRQHGTLAMDLILLHDNSISEGQLKRIPGKPLMNTGPMTVWFNQAARRVTSDFIVFLTDQNEFMDDAWLARLVADGQRAGVGFVGGAVVYANQPEIVKSAGLTLDPGRIHAPLLNGLHRLRMGGLAWLYGSCRRNVIGLELSGALVSRQKFLDAGGFNAELPTSYAATDLMLRMHSQGLRHIYTPFVVVKDGATSRRHDEKPVEPPRAVLEHFHAQWRSVIENDPYVNTQFLRNPHLEVN